MTYRQRIGVSIPDSVLEEKESPRDKTVKLGLIARACAIYGVDVIEVYRDPKGGGEADMIRKVLQYLETPQYLRRSLYPLDGTLRFAGLLPPLRIPSHKPRIPFAKVSVGEVREGVANPDGTVDVGLDIMPKVLGGAPSGRRVTVRISSLRPPVAEVIGREKVEEYWGYTVETRQVHQVLSDPRFRVRIATSRLGTPLGEALGGLRALIRGGGGVKLIFGSPSRGLYEIAGEDLDRRVDLVLNLFPAQQVKTVRTEEAVFAGLGLVSLLSLGKA